MSDLDVDRLEQRLNTITIQQKTLDDILEENIRNCYQRFAVNHCIDRARETHRYPSELLRKEDLRIRLTLREYRSNKRKTKIQAREKAIEARDNLDNKRLQDLLKEQEIKRIEIDVSEKARQADLEKAAKERLEMQSSRKSLIRQREAELEKRQKERQANGKKAVPNLPELEDIPTLNYP
jgi:tRNA U34 5-carboxymethylaminomethyl modifying enzyme MnmG/GidA